MRKVWDFAVREKNKLWFSACINLLGLMFLVLVMKPCFEMNDDSTIYELTSGAKGVYDSHTVFIHIFIGSILKLLYALLPGIQWYTVLQYFLRRLLYPYEPDENIYGSIVLWYAVFLLWI